MLLLLLLFTLGSIQALNSCVLCVFFSPAPAELAELLQEEKNKSVGEILEIHRRMIRVSVEGLQQFSSCGKNANLFLFLFLEADRGFRPAVGAVPLHGAGRAAPLRLVVGETEEARHCAAVLPRHGVVEDGVDGGAQVEENHGHHAAVLGQRGEQRGGRVQGAELQVAAHVERQPAQHEGEHHHHWRKRR